MPKKPVPEEKIPVPVAKKKEAPPAKGTVAFKVKKPYLLSLMQNILCLIICPLSYFNSKWMFCGEN